MAVRAKKPNIHWMEGVLAHFETKFPYAADDPRRLGFGVGQQIVGLYIVEMLLKYALDNAGVPHGHHHNLHQLFKNLSRQRRRAVQRKYTELLNSEFEWAWDVAETADSLLQYLGDNAITDTRYFWDRTHIGDINPAPRMLRPLIYALFIALYNYPAKPIRAVHHGKPIVKRYDTTFQSLAESFRKDQADRVPSPPST